MEVRQGSIEGSFGFLAERVGTSGVDRCWDRVWEVVAWQVTDEWPEILVADTFLPSEV